MIDQLIKQSTDLTLTPDNARNRGYKYLGDVIYEPEQCRSASADTLEMIKINGTKLGTPLLKEENDSCFGLYALAE